MPPVANQRQQESGLAKSLSDLGFGPDYWLHFGFLNETTSMTYIILSTIIFLLTGGFVLYSIAFAVSLVISVIISRLLVNRPAPIPTNAACVITGASTGIGREMAISYAVTYGFTVFATVRKESDAASLLEEFKSRPTPVSETPVKRGDVIPILADVTDEAAVTRLASQVESICHERGLILVSLVNNAGYAFPGHMETADDKAVFDQYNTNVFGLISVTNHLLPLLRQSVSKLAQAQSRVVPSIINIGSIASFMSLAPLGFYCSTKGIVKCVSETYCHELRAMGINVVTVAPGAVRTNFYSTLAKHHTEAPTMTTSTTTTIKDQKEQKVISSVVERKIDFESPVEHNVQEFYNGWIERSNQDMSTAELAAQSPETVTRTVLDIISSPRPNSFYPTGFDAVLFVPLIRYVFESGLFDMFVTRSAPALQSPSPDKKTD